MFGIYAIRCFATREIWVGQSAHLDRIQLAASLLLRLGLYPEAALQQAWSMHGETSFAFELIERLPDEGDSHLRRTRLRERLNHWRCVLHAAVL